MSIHTSPNIKAPLQNRAELQNLYSTSYQSHIEERQKFVLDLLSVAYRGATKICCDACHGSIICFFLGFVNTFSKKILYHCCKQSFPYRNVLRYSSSSSCSPDIPDAPNPIAYAYKCQESASENPVVPAVFLPKGGGVSRDALVHSVEIRQGGRKIDFFR